MAAGDFTFQIHPDLTQTTGSVSITYGEAEQQILNQYAADSLTLSNRPVIVGLSVINYAYTITAFVSQEKGLLLESLFAWQQAQINAIKTNGSWVIDADASSGTASIVIDNGRGGDVATLPTSGELLSIVGSDKIYAIDTVSANTPTADETTITLTSNLDQDVSDGDLISLACRARLRFTDEVNRTTPHPAPHPKTLVATNTLSSSGYEWGFPIYDVLFTLDDRQPRAGDELITMTVQEAKFS